MKYIEIVGNGEELFHTFKLQRGKALHAILQYIFLQYFNKT